MTETKKMKKKSTGKKGGFSTIILVILPLVILTASWLIYHAAISKGISQAYDSYKQTETEAASAAHDMIYNYIKDKAEETHHVSNRASISIGNLRKEAKLEVFRVPDTEFVIENKDDNKYGITSWIKVKGTGIFSVNLNLSEFLIDDARGIVTVRIPRLELEYDLGSDEAYIERLFVKNDIHLPTFTNETKAGKEITDRMIEEGRQMVKDEISNTPEYYFSAQESAQDVITSIIKILNPDKDVTVIVEFVD